MKNILLAVFGLVFLLLDVRLKTRRQKKQQRTPAHTGVQPAPEDKAAPEDQAPDQE